MERLKPIEPGVLCVVVNHPRPENNGKAFRVVKHLGYLDSYGLRYGPRWSIDGEIICKLGWPISHVGSNNLIRIDGTPESITEQDREVVEG